MPDSVLQLRVKFAFGYKQTSFVSRQAGVLQLAVNGAAPKDLMRLAFTSTHGGISEEDCLLLAHEALELNAKHRITGLLVVGNEDFFVVLEGSLMTVASALASIAGDERHHSINVLLASTVDKRICDSWRLIDLENLERGIKNICGDVDLLNFYPAEMGPRKLEAVILEFANIARAY